MGGFGGGDKSGVLILLQVDGIQGSKGNYEIQKQPFKKVVRPIISKTPNERWNMDLIDMSVGVIHRYILSVVDNFSGFLWTRRLLNRTAQTIVDTLQEIINANYPNGSNGTYPRLLQSDNGGEFSIGEFHEEGAVSM